MSAAELAVAFFLQMAVILAACRLVGTLARRVGQPQVVGEMIAGVLLGPSLLGDRARELRRRTGGRGHRHRRRSARVSRAGPPRGGPAKTTAPRWPSGR